MTADERAAGGISRLSTNFKDLPGPKGACRRKGGLSKPLLAKPSNDFVSDIVERLVGMRVKAPAAEVPLSPVGDPSEKRAKP